MSIEDMIAKLEGGKLANFGNGYDGAFFARCAAELTQLREALAEAEREREEYKESYRFAMVSVKDAYDKGKALAEKECDTLKAELESAKRFNGVSLVAHEKVNLKLRAQLTASRKKGYRQGVEWATMMAREYADCARTQEERDSRVMFAQQIERHLRAESSALPRTYEQGAGAFKRGAIDWIDEQLASPLKYGQSRALLLAREVLVALPTQPKEAKGAP